MTCIMCNNAAVFQPFGMCPSCSKEYLSKCLICECDLDEMDGICSSCENEVNDELALYECGDLLRF